MKTCHTHDERVMRRQQLQEELQRGVTPDRRKNIDCELKLIEEAEIRRAKVISLFLKDPGRIKY